MGLDAAWTRAMSAAFKLQGVPITVTRPSPDDTAVATRGIWLQPRDEPQPFGQDIRRRDPRRVLAIPRSVTLPNADKGTVIVAPERQGESTKTWRVEGYADATVPDELRVFVVQTIDN